MAEQPQEPVKWRRVGKWYAEELPDELPEGLKPFEDLLRAGKFVVPCFPFGLPEEVEPPDEEKTASDWVIWNRRR